MHITVNGTEIFYSRYGKGIPLLVLHGGPGLDHTYFRPALDVLGHVAELIYFDQTGNGRSGGHAATATMTVESLADDAEALCRALKLPQVCVFAHGFGGFVAQSLVHRHPHRAAGLILCSSAPALDYPEAMLAGAQSRATPAQMAALMACMTRPMATDADLATLWRQALPLYFYRFQPNLGIALADAITYSAAAYNRGLFELAPHFNSLPWLAQLRLPCLLMAGVHDWMAPMAQATGRLQGAIADSTTALFDNSGHYPFIEETTAFCHTVRHFLRGLTRA